MDRRSFLKMFSAVPVVAGIGSAAAENVASIAKKEVSPPLDTSQKNQSLKLFKADEVDSQSAPYSHAQPMTRGYVDLASSATSRNLRSGLKKDMPALAAGGDLYLCLDDNETYMYVENGGWMELAYAESDRW